MSETDHAGWVRASLLTLATAGLAVGAIVASWMAMVTPAPSDGVLGPALVVAAGGGVVTAGGDVGGAMGDPADGGADPTGDAVPASVGDAWADPDGESSPVEVTSRATPSATVPRTVSPTRVRALDVESDDSEDGADTPPYARNGAPAGGVGNTGTGRGTGDDRGGRDAEDDTDGSGGDKGRGGSGAGNGSNARATTSTGSTRTTTTAKATRSADHEDDEDEGDK